MVAKVPLHEIALVVWNFLVLMLFHWKETAVKLLKIMN